MKFSTLVVVLSAALALSTTGCRYNKANKVGSGADAGSQDDTSLVSNIDSDMLNGQSGSLDALANGAGDFDKLYARCSDVAFAPVYFGFDSAVIPGGEMEKIDSVVAHLAERTDRVVIVEGHCDERGSNEYNMSLGENRAGIVRDYLVNNGIAVDRIQTRSYGSEKPAVEGHDEGAWSKNRRGEFAIFQK